MRSALTCVLEGHTQKWMERSTRGELTQVLQDISPERLERDWIDLDLEQQSSTL